MIELNRVSYSYSQGRECLKDINFSLSKGKRIFVLGANGAGKSTLFLLLAGLIKPKDGDLLFFDKKFRFTSKETLALRERVGIVFQDPECQLFAPVVLDEVSFGPRNLGLSAIKAEERALEALETLGIEALKDSYTPSLSFGQKKRVSLASILSMDPDLLLLDEPLVYLDPRSKKNLQKILEDLSRRGKSLVVSTHDVEFAYSFADYIYVMKEGRVISEGSPQEVFSKSELMVEASLEQPLSLKIWEQLSETHLKGISLEEYLDLLR